MFTQELKKVFSSKSYLSVFLVMLFVSLCNNAELLYSAHLAQYGTQNFHPVFASLLTGFDYIRWDLIIIYALPAFIIFAYSGKYATEKSFHIENLYLLRSSRSKAFYTRIGVASISAFVLFASVCLLNLFGNMVVNPGGDDFMGAENMALDAVGYDFYFAVHSPYLNYFLFILTGSFAAALLAVLCQSVSYIICDNRISILVCVTIWLCYFQDYPLFVGGAFSPFGEDGFRGVLTSISAFLPVVVISLVIAICVKRRRQDEL